MNSRTRMKKKSNFLLVFDTILPERKINDSFLVIFSLSLLFIISATYFYFFGNGIFFHQENNSLFIFSSEYFQKYTSKPGGLLVYAGNFLMQFYHNSLFGSLILPALLIILCLVFKKINERLLALNSFSLLFTLLPSCFLFLLQTRYNVYVHNSLGYLLAVTWFLITIKTAGTGDRFIVFCLFPLIYYIIGSFIFLYLGISVTFFLLYEKGKVRYYISAVLALVAFLTFIIFKNFVFLQPVSYLSGYPLFFNDLTKLSLYSYIFSGFLFIFPLFTYIINNKFNTINSKFIRIIPLATILILFPVSIFILIKKYEPGYENLMKTEKLVYKGDWDGVIKQHEKFPSTNIIGQYYYNLALTEKGQLCDRLFYSSQNFGPMSVTLSRDGEQAFRAVYFYYAIGQIGEAHHLAYELMVQHGYRPENIKMLIKTELINGNYKIAERYINVLKKTLYYKNWADKYGKMLYKPLLISSDPELGEKISLLPKTDFFVAVDDILNLELFLKANPRNKRAFEAKIARLLLEKDLLEVVTEVKKMKEMGYSDIPRNIEEALVAFKYFAKQSVELGDLSIRPETENHFTQYISVFNYYGGKKPLLEKMMKKPEKNTFWYYLQFSVVKTDLKRSSPDKNYVY